MAGLSSNPFSDLGMGLFTEIDWDGPVVRDTFKVTK